MVEVPNLTGVIHRVKHQAFAICADQNKLLFAAAAEAQHFGDEVVMAEYREVIVEAESAAIGRFPVSNGRRALQTTYEN